MPARLEAAKNASVELHLGSGLSSGHRRSRLRRRHERLGGRILAGGPREQEGHEESVGGAEPPGDETVSLRDHRSQPQRKRGRGDKVGPQQEGLVPERHLQMERA